MLVWLGAFAMIGAVGTALARAYAVRRNLVDLPGERRSHSVATPRGGGVSLVVAMAVAASVLAVHVPGQGAMLLAFLVGMLLVAMVGWIDDHRPLSPWARLGVHLVSAAILAAGVLASGGPYSLALAAFVLAVGLTNVWNFMDGINGIAASQALLAASGLAVMAGGAWAWVAAALAAACLGFLPFNFPRARIFMGDVGSGAVGFALAALMVAAMGGRPETWPLVLLPPSAFLVDAGLTLMRRVARGERWWTAHVQHAYQVWGRRRGHVAVTLSYAGWTMASLLIVALVSSRPAWVGLAAAVAWYMSGAFFWGYLQKRYPMRDGGQRE